MERLHFPAVRAEPDTLIPRSAHPAAPKMPPGTGMPGDACWGGVDLGPDPGTGCRQQLRYPSRPSGQGTQHSAGHHRQPQELQSRLEQGTSTIPVPVPVPARVPAAQTAAVAQWDHQPGTGVSFAPAWEDGDAGLALPDTRADWVTRAIADPPGTPWDRGAGRDFAGSARLARQHPLARRNAGALSASIFPAGAIE